MLRRIRTGLSGSNPKKTPTFLRFLLKYDVVKVFVTGETEEGKRAALSELSIGRWDVYMKNKDVVAPSAIFRGNLLRVDHPNLAQFDGLI
jgi:hypothetical protein